MRRSSVFGMTVPDYRVINIDTFTAAGIASMPIQLAVVKKGVPIVSNDQDTHADNRLADKYVAAGELMG